MQRTGFEITSKPTGAVLCGSSIAPECISKVIDFKGNVLYQNDLLNQTAPGDRKANLDLGSTIKQARVYLELKQGMKEWPQDAGDTQSAVMEKKYYASYDRNFNDEQMCAKCKQLNF